MNTSDELAENLVFTYMNHKKTTPAAAATEMKGSPSIADFVCEFVENVLYSDDMNSAYDGDSESYTFGSTEDSLSASPSFEVSFGTPPLSCINGD